MILRYPIAGILAVVISAPAFAEVGDKLPTMGAFWGWAAGLNLAAVALSVFRNGFGLLVLPVGALLAIGSFEMVNDPFLGPAILEEMGQGYVDAAMWSAAAMLLGPIVITICVTMARRKSSAT